MPRKLYIRNNFCQFAGGVLLFLVFSIPCYGTESTLNISPARFNGINKLLSLSNTIPNLPVFNNLTTDKLNANSIKSINNIKPASAIMLNGALANLANGIQNTTLPFLEFGPLLNHLTLPIISSKNLNHLLILFVTLLLIFVRNLPKKCDLQYLKLENSYVGFNFVPDSIYASVANHNIPASKLIPKVKSSADGNTKIEDILQYACSLLATDIGVIASLNETRNLVEFVHSYADQSIKFNSANKQNLSNSVFADILQNDNDLIIDIFSNSNDERISNIEIKSYIATKLFINNRFYGLMFFARCNSYESYSEHERTSFTIINSWISDNIGARQQMDGLSLEKNIAIQSNKSKSTFLANMSHEIRTPLTAIIGYSDMLLEDSETASNIQNIEDIHKIQISSKHLLRIINNVLDLSKIEAGKIEADIIKFNMYFLVCDTLEISQTLALKNNNSIVCNISPKLELVTTDETLLRQCLLNLISNACKFTHNGNITVDVEEHFIPMISNSTQNEPHRWIYISVSDTGIGIPEETLDKLFQDFCQVHHNNVALYGGTGLGLAISYRMTNLLGGDIIVESELEKGSKFTIRIPDQS